MSESFRLHRRFDRMARLAGEQPMARLARSHVMVIGLGGVGSFAAESLVRSGVGTVSLVDFDLVCVTNVNRRQAMRGTVGKPKANVLAERLRLINPQATVKAVPLFYEARNWTCSYLERISRILSSTPSTMLPQSVISSKPVATRACRWSALLALLDAGIPPKFGWPTSLRPRSTRLP